MNTDVGQQQWVAIESNGVSPLFMESIYNRIYGNDCWKVRDEKLYVHESVVPVRRFPYDYSESKQFDEIEIVSSFSKQRVEDTCTSMNGSHQDEWRMISLMFGDLDYYIAARGMQLHSEPLHSQSRQQGSYALYYGTYIGKSCTYLLQCLPTRATTSRHYHKHVQEFFNVLEGSTLIFLGGRAYTVTPPNVLMVPGGCMHRLTTEELPSLTLIVMDGSRSGLSRDDHHYHE